MNRGKIVSWKADKGFGFIQPDGTRHRDQQIFFHISDTRLDKHNIREDLVVTYEVGVGQGGKSAAKNIRVISDAPIEKSYKPKPFTPQKAQQANLQEQGSDDEQKYVDQTKTFLNPYNFIRPIYRKREPHHVLGNCPPPPHDRYVGRTGRITCKLTVETPLFVTDSHAVEIRKIEQKDESGKGMGIMKDHPVYRFFRSKEKPTIPASTLRGTIRSIFEASTNSCFSSFTEKKLSYHYSTGENTGKAPWLVPARVETHGDKCYLRLLPGASNLQIIPDDLDQLKKGPRGEQYAAWLYRYWPIKPSGSLTKTDRINRQTRNFQSTRRKGGEVSVNGLGHGDEVFALIERRQHAHPHIRYWDVLEVESAQTTQAELELKRRITDSRNQKVVRGWLCLNNKNIETKHSERLFYALCDPRNHTVVELPEEVQKAYELLIEDYQERHSKIVNKLKADAKSPEKSYNNKPALSRFIFSTLDRKVQTGTLVYAMLSGSIDKPIVDFIVPVSVPRVGYERSIADLLDPTNESSHLHRCTQYEELCPACRTFGWVHDAPEKDVEITAFASRIRFSQAEFDKDDLQQGERTLAILSSPKPTTTLFYLKKSQSTLPDGGTDYDSSNAHLRGRKLYRHHYKLYWEEATRSSEDGSDQNRTIREFMPKGKSAEFTVEFHNLADEELGALLWSLELDEGMFHRVGYGKPLGFGSVNIEIIKLQLLHPTSRYSSNLQDGWDDVTAQCSKLVQAFKDEFSRLYGNGNAFDAMDNVCDLHALLSAPTNPDIPIHYPRSYPDPQASDENFTWFLGNKNKRHQPLPFASDDRDGFEYWDRNGNSQ